MRFVLQVCEEIQLVEMNSPFYKTEKHIKLRALSSLILVSLDCNLCTHTHTSHVKPFHCSCPPPASELHISAIDAMMDVRA